MPIDPHLLQDLYSAHRRLGAGTAPGFILGWTAFNHIYGAHWDDAPPPGRRDGDREQLLHYAALPLVAEVRAMASKSLRAAFALQLPLLDRRGRPVPAGVPAGRRKAADLNVEQFLLLVYEIRNSFVHGSQRFRDLDGQARTKFAEGFAEFLTLLLKRVAPGVHP